jgi:hypothetical protein
VKVTGGWGKLHAVVFTMFPPHLASFSDKIEENEMREECSTRGRGEKLVRYCVRRTWKKRPLGKARHNWKESGPVFIEPSDYYDAPIYQVVHFIRDLGLIKG